MRLLLSPLTASLLVSMGPPRPLHVIQRAPAPQANLVGRIAPLPGIAHPPVPGQRSAPRPKLRLVTEIPELRGLIRDADSTRLGLTIAMLEDTFAAGNVADLEEEASAADDNVHTDDGGEDDGPGNNVHIGPSFPV